jgi:glycosyltransferase involved in cell wall biosynthesis
LNKEVLMTTGSLEVIFAPYGEKNPYQKQLRLALAKRGVHVRPGKPSSVTFPKLLVRSELPDVLHIHWVGPFFLSQRHPRQVWRASLRALAFVLQLKAMRRSRTKIVWTAHNLHNHENDFPRLDRLCHWAAAQYADAVIVHSPEARQALLDSFGPSPSKVTCIPHGHYIGWYPNTVPREQAREQLDLPQDALVYAFLGQIRTYKNVPLLIDSFRQIRERAAHLLIAGHTTDTSLRQTIQRQVQNIRNVSFYDDYVPDEEIQLYLKAADVVVLPYRDILTSGAAILAMSFGLPIIAPDTGGLPGLVGEDGGFLYRPDRQRGLLEALRQAAEQRDKLGAMGRRNYQHVLQWDWDMIAGRTQQIYASSGS